MPQGLLEALQTLLGKPPQTGPVNLPREAPNRPLGQDKLGDVIDGLLAAVGIKDPLAPGAPQAQQVGSVLQMAVPMMAGLKGIKAYHGSPHDFDKFSMQKIGTGEGAQAYGHGLYFAENENVARGYSEMWPATHRGSRVRIDGQDPFKLAQENVKLHGPNEITRAYQRLVEDGGIDEAIRNSSLDASYPDPAAHRLLREWKATRTIETPHGRMYEVNINADPEHFLDWDRPLSEQSPHVQQVVTKAYGDVRPVRRHDGTYSITTVYPDGSGQVLDYGFREPTPEAAMAKYREAVAQQPGRLAYHEIGDTGPRLTEPVDPQTHASETLRKAGIPGIRYLDAGSRDARQGTSNYVVFDDAIIDILRKFGLMLPLAGAAAGAQRNLNVRQDGIQ